MSTKLVTGISKGENASVVAREAANMAAGKLDGSPIGLVIVYCSSKYDYQEVVNTVRAATGNAPLIGCSTGGEFTEDQVYNESIAVGILASDSMKFFTAMASGLKENEMESAKKLAEALPSTVEGYPNKSAIVLIDGLAGKGEEISISIANVLGIDTTLTGGAAGDDLAFKVTHVFCNDEVATNAASICMIASKSPVVVSVRHGHTPLSGDLKVTKATANVLYEVNDRPAWEVWKEEAKEDAAKIGINVDELNDASKQGAFLLRYELGVPSDDKYKVRVPLAVNEDGSLNFACTIPQGMTFNIMKSVEEKQIESAKEAMELAVKNAGGAKIAGALVFDCVCRGIILGDKFAQAVDEFKKVLGAGVPVFGFETYGEICMSAGDFTGFHNTTSVIMLLPEN
ncbi:FIST signal transduction protein [Candidatus Margulisiibacteriota bacterium]